MKSWKHHAILSPAVTPESLSRRQVTRLDRHKGGRHYQVAGEAEAYPSVTTVLNVINKPALIPWAKNMTLDAVREALAPRIGKRPLLTQEWVDEMVSDAKDRSNMIKDTAADFGTTAHGYIEDILKGRDVKVPPDFETVVENFLAWQNESRLNVTFSEVMVYSIQHQFAGSMDAVATRRGKLVALDWKTSSGLYREMDLQVAAYAHALSEMTDQPVDEAWVVRFGKKEAEFECRQVRDLAVCFEGFKGAMGLWRALKADPSPRWRK